MVYVSKAIVALIHLAFVSTLPETLPEAERRPFAGVISYWAVESFRRPLL
jgi:hypothetical protein